MAKMPPPPKAGAPTTVSSGGSMMPPPGVMSGGSMMPPPGMTSGRSMPPPPVSGGGSAGPVNLQPGESVVTLSAGSQTYSAGSSATYIYGNTGSDTINGGSSGQSTVDYSKLQSGVTLGAEGVVSKGTGGTDALINIKTIVGAAGQNNTITGAGVTSGVSFTADLSAHSISVNNIPGLGSLSFNIYDFETIDGPNAADTFIGDGRNDTFVGGAGSVFTTGSGNDTLTGGQSNDVFNVGAGHTTITDFSVAGGDVIDSQTALTRVSAIQGGTLVSFAGGGTVALLGVTPSSLHDSTAIKIG